MILSLRLHFTFKDSMFQISKYKRYPMNILVGISFINMNVSILYHFFIGPDTIYFIILAIPMIMYFPASIYGMMLFVQKMYALAKMRASSYTNHRGSVFNVQQKQLLYTTTKYASLLSLALISTFVFHVLVMIENAVTGEGKILSSPMASIDCVINILCLYLQYPFADEFYKKFCICFGKCCLYLLTKHAKRKIQRESKMDRIIQLGEHSPVSIDDGIPESASLQMVPTQSTVSVGDDNNIE